MWVASLLITVLALLAGWRVVVGRGRGGGKRRRKADGVTYIGDLEIYEKCILGYGSCGTIVFEGKFGSRPVAVKRMLR